MRTKSMHIHLSMLKVLIFNAIRILAQRSSNVELLLSTSGEMSENGQSQFVVFGFEMGVWLNESKSIFFFV